MSSSAAHLVERVLPDQTLRQWVATFPQPLPRLLAWRPKLLAKLLADLSRVIQEDLRRRTGEPTGRTGMISFVQNFTGDLRCFVHIHALVPDGVFVEHRQDIHFVPAPIPTKRDIQAVTEALAERVRRSCARWQRRLAPTEEDRAAERLDLLAGLGEEHVRGPRRRSSGRPTAHHRRWLGTHLGVQLHAGVTAARGDTRGRERLARYVARPALCLKRIYEQDDGWLLVQFKRPWRNGTSGVRLEPSVFVLRLASLVMPAKVNLIRYHGVFAPASPWRSRVVPEPPEAPVSRRHARWIHWAKLMQHVFGRSDACPQCGQTMTYKGSLDPKRAAEVLFWIDVAGDLIEPGEPP